jgi:tetratricopeptide (TPR) repeat protein
VAQSAIAREFVGRTAELEELERGLSAVEDGHGRLFLIVGGPGIGKTRLAEELADRARGRGARVLRGACWESGEAPAYWPWVQVLRAYLRQLEPAAPASELGPAAHYLAQIDPALRRRFPELRAAPSLETMDARFALADALTEFLTQLATERPLVLVIDDLHAAARDSLMLLQHLARSIHDARVFVLGAYRPFEATAVHGSAESLAAIARQGTLIPLGGLSSEEVDRLVELRMGRSPSLELSRAVFQLTEGTPLFVDETVRWLRAEGRLDLAPNAPAVLGIPPTVRALITRRLTLLSAEARRALTVASVIGREFSEELLSRASRLVREPLRQHLDEASLAGIVREVSTSSLWTFGHALFREALYESADESLRAELHRDVAHSIEELEAANLDPYLGALAHHWTAAVPSAGASHALDYSRRAGELALAALAYEEAAEHFGRAIDLSRREPDDPGRLCDLVLAHAEALWRIDDPAAFAQFVVAAELARRQGSAERLARAALGHGASVWAGSTAQGTDETSIALLREAERALAGAESPLAIRVLAQLAVALHWSSDHDEREAASRRALEMARHVHDPAALVVALHARYLSLGGPGTIEQCLELADEVVALGAETADKEALFLGRRLRARVLFQKGDLDSAELERAACAKLAEELRVRGHRLIVLAQRMHRATVEGRFDDAERFAEQGLAGANPGDATQPFVFGVGLLFVRLLQGRFEELLAVTPGIVESHPRGEVLRPVMTWAYAEAGRETEARELFERYAARGFDAIPRDDYWFAALFMLSRACALLRDAPRAEALYDLLAPYAETNATLGPSAVALGSLHAPLGALAATISRWEDAERHFDRALERNRAWGYRPFAALVLRDYADMLVRRGGDSHSERAVALAQDATNLMRTIGMSGYVSRAEGILAASRAQASREEAILKREADSWVVAFGGRTHRFKDSKGLHYLARLLMHPHAEWHVLDLVAATEEPFPPTQSISRKGMIETGLSTGRLFEVTTRIDAAAKASYRARLSDLAAELEEARRWNDPERAQRIAGEVDGVKEELSRALGIGPRDRGTTSPAGRARLNVTRAIQAATRRIATECPPLGKHLAATVRTGWFCAYHPDPRAPICWAV